MKVANNINERVSVQCEHLHTILCKPFLSASFWESESKSVSAVCTHRNTDVTQDTLIYTFINFQQVKWVVPQELYDVHLTAEQIAPQIIIRFLLHF